MQGSGKNSGENLIQSDSENQGEAQLDEGILPGILANEISMDTEYEAMKAQAVIARTNCIRSMETGADYPDGLTKSELLHLWGQQNFTQYYSQLESCVQATRGMVMTYDGACIQADFHAASAGYTRDASEVYGSGEYAYLKRVDSRRDITSPDFLKVTFYTPEEFVSQGSEFFSEETKENAESVTAAQLLEKMSVTERDSSGYATEVTVEGQIFAGEQVRLAYGWNSSAFYIKEVDGQIRVLTKGCGHGWGESLYGANQMAKEGASYVEILNAYYTGIEIVQLYE
jgi:stage II sporulation protein D